MGLITKGKIELIISVAQFIIVKTNISPVQPQGQPVPKRSYKPNVGLSDTHEIEIGIGGCEFRSAQAGQSSWIPGDGIGIICQGNKGAAHTQGPGTHKQLILALYTDQGGH